MSSLRRWPLACAASFVVAGGSAGLLAVRNAPRFDELHTLAYARQDGLGEVWTAYRQVRDTLPPTAYVLAWLWAQVAGTGLIATRLPSVLAWGVAAAALSALARRAGPWAAFVAGIVPTATALVFLGAFARPYAVAFAALASALVCWERAGDPAAAGRWWLAGCAGFCAVASILHYAMAAPTLVVGLVALATGTDRARRRERVIAPVVGGLVPVLASAALLPAAIRDQGRLPRSVSALDAVRFWPSTLLPARPVLVFAMVGVALTAVWAVRHYRAEQAYRPNGAGLQRELVVLGWALMVVVPVAVVAAMTVTSGTYVHRYAVAALAGAALLAAHFTGLTGRLHQILPPVVAFAVVVGAVAAGGDTANQMVSVNDASSLPDRLGLATAGGREVLVADEYDFLLLQAYAPPDLRARLRLASDPVVADSGPVVNLASRLEVHGASDSPSFDFVGSSADLDRLLPPGTAWRATPLATTSYVRPGVPRQLVRYRLEPR